MWVRVIVRSGAKEGILGYDTHCPNGDKRVVVDFSVVSNGRPIAQAEFPWLENLATRLDESVTIDLSAKAPQQPDSPGITEAFGCWAE